MSVTFFIINGDVPIRWQLLANRLFGPSYSHCTYQISFNLSDLSVDTFVIGNRHETSENNSGLGKQSSLLTCKIFWQLLERLPTLKGLHFPKCYVMEHHHEN